ncbi:MAG: aminoacyl-tRNA hydrolase [Oscillospiraceae bacterium]|jgi:PTH1 family peptidyl-tRNA hydrolase
MFRIFNSRAVEWLVVFLGNPGLEYANTRHNVGFMAADALEKSKGLKINKFRFKSLTARCSLGDSEALLMKPQTYMNLSGEAVSEAARFYKIPPERVLVVSDDVALPLGKLRVRTHGSAGGHNGLKSIISQLGSEMFPRIRIGVGIPPHPEYDIVDWVLSKFSGQDAKVIAETAKLAAEAVESYIRDGAQKTMNKYN